MLALILMLGLVPVLNIPFDWASLGLTRALLRRGCEAAAPSPLLLGLLDFALGLVLLVLLALALIAALQVADALIVAEGRRPVGTVVALLDAMENNPRDPGNYWAYVTLFSTLIPSALNAVIGSVSLVTWWFRPAREWALTKIALLDEAGREGTHRRLVTLLSAQAALGTLLVCLALKGLWELLLETPEVFATIIRLLRWWALLFA